MEITNSLCSAIQLHQIQMSEQKTYIEIWDYSRKTQ